MKNKKGFTLIEIIISISLIILIGILSIVFVNKDKLTEEEQIEKYKEKVILDSSVYFENNKDKLLKFKQLKNIGDYAVIQLKELIDNGLLEENLYNPIRKTSSRESDFDCLKVFINADGNIDIEYPYAGVCENKEEDEIAIIMKKGVFIHLSDENNKELILPSSQEIYNIYNLNVDIINDIQNGDYILKYYDFKAPSYELRTSDGITIATSNDYEVWNNQGPTKKTENGTWSKKWEYVYEINENSDLLKDYLIIESNKQKKIEIEQVDNSAPILVDANGNVQYDVISLNTYFSKQFERYKIEIEQYKSFDNYDGFIDIDISDNIEYDEKIEEHIFNNYLNTNYISLYDSSNNNNEYLIDFNTKEYGVPLIDSRINGLCTYKENGICPTNNYLYEEEEHNYGNDCWYMNNDIYYIKNAVNFESQNNGQIDIIQLFENPEYGNNAIKTKQKVYAFDKLNDDYVAYQEFISTLKCGDGTYNYGFNITHGYINDIKNLVENNTYNYNLECNRCKVEEFWGLSNNCWC